MSLNIRKGDLVQIMTGDDRFEPAEKDAATGKATRILKRGRVISVDPKKGQVTVEGVNINVYHEKVRQTKDGNTGGREEREAPIPAGNVALVDPKTGKPVRVGVKVVNGKRVRYTKGRNASGVTLDDAK